MPFDRPAEVNEFPTISDAEMLGTSLRKARRASGLSQRALAGRAEIDLATVQGLERGSGTVLPLLAVLNALAYRFSDQTDSHDFGRWVAGRRKLNRLSQDALATKIGVSKPTIIQIERGRGNIRSLLRVLDALCIGLSVEPRSSQDPALVGEPDRNYVIYEGDNIDHLKSLPDSSVDSVVTDPPYGIDYMASDWDGSVPAVELWKEILRVLKPGGYLLSFGGTRTYHRMVVAVEDAGFEIRDQISWLYGQGMPKSRNVSKDIDRIYGAKREVIGRIKDSGYAKVYAELGGQTRNVTEYDVLDRKPVTAVAAQFDGYGTGLKPAQEPIVVAQKPFSKKHAIAKNVLLHGVGALNIDACRIGTTGGTARSHQAPYGAGGRNKCWRSGHDVVELEAGRFPANVIHDGSPEVLHTFPQAGDFSTARYFYCAKPSATERAGNKHPTVKPLALMSYLVRLVTPVGGTVLDPFAGSGTTGAAAVADGFTAILMERDPMWVATIRRRMQGVQAARESGTSG